MELPASYFITTLPKEEWNSRGSSEASKEDI
jgi:hypothetical protein